MIMRWLAQQCFPLDVHTPYTYWVNASYYSQCCFLLEDDEKPIGYIMAIDAPMVVFIWQIGILKEYRKKGLSYALISSCMDYAVSVEKNIELTIAYDNDSSYAAFKTACQKRNLSMEKLEQIEVLDMADHSFKETEIKYLIKILE